MDRWMEGQTDKENEHTEGQTDERGTDGRTD